MRVSFFIQSALLAKQTLAFPVQEYRSLPSTNILRRQDQSQPPALDLPKEDVLLQSPGITNIFIKAEDLDLPEEEKPDNNFQKVDSANPPLAAEGAEAGKNTLAGGGNAGENTLDEGTAHTSLRQAELPPDIAGLTCTNAGVTDANEFDQDRWAALSTDKVLSLANAEWMTAKRRGKTRLGYTQFMSNYFNGPEGMICSEISNKPCTQIVQCDDTNHPAGYFILNSMATMHGNMYTQLDVARGDLTGSMKRFMDTFAPKSPPDMSVEIFKTILDTALMAASLGSAFSWNKLIKTSPRLTSDDRGWAKDSFNAQLAFAFNVAKDNRKGPTNMAEQAMQLEDVANQYYIIMSDMIIQFNKAVFDGSANGLKMMTAAFREGKFMPNNGVEIDTKAFKDEINGAVYGKLMVQAWRNHYDKKHWPIILETDEPCNGKRSMTGKWFSDDTAKKTMGCVDGKAYYLLDAVEREPCAAYEECKDAGEDWFRPLPGGDNPNFKTGKWGALSIDLIARSARDGYKLNSEKNGWEQKVEPPKDGDVDAWFDNLSLGAPGYWAGISFCSRKGFDQAILDLNDSTLKRGPYFPCR